VRSLDDTCTMGCSSVCCCNATAATELYTLSLHDALPISRLWLKGTIVAVLLVAMIAVLALQQSEAFSDSGRQQATRQLLPPSFRDRKSTRLNSSHRTISYAVFCLKKKKEKPQDTNASRRG